MLVRELTVVFPRQGVIRRLFFIELPRQHIAVTTFDESAYCAAALEVIVTVKHIIAHQTAFLSRCFYDRAYGTVYGHRIVYCTVVAPICAACGEVVKTSQLPYNREEQNITFDCVKLKHAADLGDPILHRVFPFAKAGFAPFKFITPLRKHLATTRTLRLAHVPKVANNIIYIASHFDIDNLSLLSVLRRFAFCADTVTSPQLLKREMPLEHGLSLVTVRVIAVGEDVEEIAIVHIPVPIAHEVSEEPKFLFEEPSFAHVVLEFSHRFLLLIVCRIYSNLRANGKKIPETHRPRP